MTNKAKEQQDRVNEMRDVLMEGIRAKPPGETFDPHIVALAAITIAIEGYQLAAAKPDEVRKTLHSMVEFITRSVDIVADLEMN